MIGNQKKSTSRPPIVVVMGHVDHGKTTLLDYIRRTTVAARESGGITQHIGAYEIEHPPTGGRRITFIDTPGHEAFSKMRGRGARVADIAILVVAADEGVKPQTEDAIAHIKAADIPFIVAINKIDKPSADPEKVKQQLSTKGVLVEGWGGKIPCQAISAKSGEGVNALLDLILLVADLEELKSDLAKPGEGVVIESHLDSRRGPTATLIITDGTVKQGEPILAGSAKGKIKILEDFSGKPRESLAAGSAARVLGWEIMPDIGSKFVTGPQAAKPSAAPARPAQTAVQAGETGIILKADFAGSLEALQETVEKLAKESGIAVRILAASVGDIAESDAKLADAFGATIIAFRSKMSREAEGFVKMRPQKILQGEVIYELLDNLREEFKARAEALKAPGVTGRLEILATFGEKGGRQIVGGKVLEGVIAKGLTAKIVRRGSVLASGKIANLQLNRQDVQKVTAGNECGLLIDSPIKIANGDILEISG